MQIFDDAGNVGRVLNLIQGNDRRLRGVNAAVAQKVEDQVIISLAERRALIEPLQVEIEPVSYTHLRAHETVLDLVCRLLLEKKNEKKKKKKMR